MKKKIATILIPLALFGYMMFQGGCVKEDFDTVPRIKDTSNLVTSATIAEVKALLLSSSDVEKVKDLATTAFWQKVKERNANDSTIVIEGYVTSNDSTGNFYEVFTIQDTTGGIDIKVNTSDLYTIYRLKPGQKVKVKVNDLYLSTYYNAYQLGFAIVETGALDIVGIPSGEVNKYVQRTGYRKKLIPDTLTLAQVNADANYNYAQTFVCIKDVQFNEPTGSYSVPGTSTNRTLTDSLGNTLVLRTSGYATFNKESVATGKGTITGVLTRYSTTRQLVIRDLNDVQFTHKRYEPTVPTPNTTIAELKAMCTSSPYLISSDVVIEGVIAGNDKSGNIYTQLFIQDDNAGIEFKVYVTGLFAEYPVGAKVVINCKGLYLGIEKNAVKLGGLYNGSFGKLDASVFYQKIFVTEYDQPVEPISTTIATLNDALIGRLISIDDAQFIDSDLGKSWSESTAATNRYISDIYTNKISENKLIVYTSNKCDFATTNLPTGRGKFIAILSKYNTSYELIVRDLSEIRMISPRFSYLLSQDFSSASLGSAISVNGWQTVAADGTKVWTAKMGSNNTYAEVNATNSGEATNTAWLISPQIDLSGTTNAAIYFQTAYNSWATTSTLEVLVSSDYDGSNPASAHWTSLSGVQLAQQTDAASTWISSNIAALSQFSGKVYVGFKYTNTGGTTATTFRVDNVKIFPN